MEKQIKNVTRRKRSAIDNVLPSHNENLFLDELLRSNEPLKIAYVYVVNSADEQEYEHMLDEYEHLFKQVLHYKDIYLTRDEMIIRLQGMLRGNFLRKRDVRSLQHLLSITAYDAKRLIAEYESKLTAIYDKVRIKYADGFNYFKAFVDGYEATAYSDDDAEVQYLNKQRPYLNEIWTTKSGYKVDLDTIDVVLLAQTREFSSFIKGELQFVSMYNASRFQTLIIKKSRQLRKAAFAALSFILTKSEAADIVRIDRNVQFAENTITILYNREINKSHIPKYKLTKLRAELRKVAYWMYYEQFSSYFTDDERFANPDYEFIYEMTGVDFNPNSTSTSTALKNVNTTRKFVCNGGTNRRMMQVTDNIHFIPLRI